MLTEPLNFQSIIMTLQDFWARQGCLIWQPYYSQLGAGTMNPATALRVLGPEPWRVAYVEPSIRPDDGRYGENPNRMQMHYQFQVILKPDPGNPQEIYLESLQALGIDPHKHDIRFVEDNWESPALAAWGLGWEVWLDGQEITQFTYFQQSGGVQLDPVSVEITYGLERIAIALQRVNSFRDIRWNAVLTDGDVNLQAEQEHSKYYFEVADVSRLRQMYDLFEAEAETSLANNLVLPAHDYVLKCSHTFNVLDARGAVGVTERQALFGRMRELSRRVAQAYLDSRQRLEYPWLAEQEEQSPGTAGGLSGAKSSQLREVELPFASPATLLVEIGSEEMPAGDLSAALSQLQENVPKLLAELRLSYGSVRILGTPRRLVIYVEELAPFQPDLEQLVKGPPADRAFSADGLPTQAGLGFARSKGIDIHALQVREIDGGRYAVAVIHQTGKPAASVLAEELPGLIASLHFEKVMRWNSPNLAFSRPIRWLLALLGDGDASQVIPFEYAGLKSGNVTRGLRFHQPDEFPVTSPVDYFSRLGAQGIILDPIKRRQAVQSQVDDLAIKAGGTALLDVDLLGEVAHLVEAPTAFLGSFDPAHLKLPREVLTSVMKKHQRVFPVLQTGDHATQAQPRKAAVQQGLLPYFIAVRNGNQFGLEQVIEGNEHVIRARFVDAAYFVREDLKNPLEAFLPKLEKLTFQTRLGSMLDKTQRIKRLVAELAQRLSLEEGDQKTALRAAELCKADLATAMVIDMTSLQGWMGREYAVHSGESSEVAQAIFEHYLPRSTGDMLPVSLPGLLVGLADRLDTLVGLFAAGLAPTGNKDPFAQRRAALGLVSCLTGWSLDLDLQQAIILAAQQLPIPSSPEAQRALLDFIVERQRNLLLEQGSRYDVVDAVLAVQGANPARAARAVQQLSAWTARPDWNTILPAYARCVRITREFDQIFPIDRQVFIEPEESQLFTAIQTARAVERQVGSVDDFLNAFLPLIPAINHFFDRVLVMAEDEKVRINRLALVQQVARMAEGVADFSRLEGF
jgi:glycyl-tRNA synthetase